MPVLEELYPGAGSNISRAAALLREDLAALEGLAAGLVHRRGGEVFLALDELEGAPPALRRYAVRLAHAELASRDTRLDSDAVERLLTLAGKREGTTLTDLPGGVISAVRFGTEISFYKDEGSSPVEKELVIGEQGFGGWMVGVEEVGRFDSKDAARAEVAYLDTSRGPYRVRVAREGDTIRPLGLGGEKKVFRAMMDRKVPKDLRRKTPVVVDRFGKVAWVFMGEISEGAKIGRTVEKILRLEVRKTSEDV